LRGFGERPGGELAQVIERRAGPGLADALAQRVQRDAAARFAALIGEAKA